MTRRTDLGSDHPVMDLFSGAGGAALGFKSAGFSVKLGADSDPANVETFSENIGVKAVEVDLFKTGPEELLDAVSLHRGELSVLLGCPPCQGFSTLGKMESDDERNELVGRFVDILDGIRPRVFAFENVPKITEQDAYFGVMTRRIERLGYTLRYDRMDMRDYGVPQRRFRLVCVGSLDRDVMMRFSFPERTHSWDGGCRLQKWRTVKDAIFGLPALKAGESSSEYFNHKVGTHSEAMMNKIRKIPHDGGSRSDLPKDMWYPCHKRGGKAVGYKDVLGRMAWNEPSPTITTGCFNPTKGRFLHPEQDREISMREAARLQTFPDTFKFSDKTTVAARQIGNALPPRYSEMLANNIMNALEGGTVEYFSAAFIMGSDSKWITSQDPEMSSATICQG